MNLLKIAVYTGRIDRLTWWRLQIIGFALMFLAYAVPAWISNSEGGLVTFFVWFFAVWLGLSAGIRRLHDLNRSGTWMWLFILMPLGLIMTIWFGFFPGTPGPNRHGPPHSGSPFRGP